MAEHASPGTLAHTAALGFPEPLPHHLTAPIPHVQRTLSPPLPVQQLLLQHDTHNPQPALLPLLLMIQALIEDTVQPGKVQFTPHFMWLEWRPRTQGK